MRTSCISHPARDHFFQIRDWQLQFTGNNFCAALLLSEFEFWHNVNQSKVEDGERKDCWQRRDREELAQAMFGQYKDWTISHAIQLLKDKGAIEIKAKPGYDRTNLYLFCPEVLQRFIDEDYRPKKRGQKRVSQVCENHTFEDEVFTHSDGVKNTASCAGASRNTEITRAAAETRAREAADAAAAASSFPTTKQKLRSRKRMVRKKSSVTKKTSSPSASTSGDTRNNRQAGGGDPPQDFIKWKLEEAREAGRSIDNMWAYMNAAWRGYLAEHGEWDGVPKYGTGSGRKKRDRVRAAQEEYIGRRRAMIEYGLSGPFDSEELLAEAKRDLAQAEREYAERYGGGKS